MTKSVNEVEDPSGAGGATGQGALLSASLFVWILWPAVFVLIFRDATYDFVGMVLRDCCFYPTSLINVTTYWAGREPVYKSIYISLWYLNSLMIAFCYFLYLIGDLQRSRVPLRGFGPRLRAIGLSLFGILVPLVMYSAIAFDVEPSLTYQERFLMEHYFGQFLLLPLIYVGGACAPLGAVDLLVAALRGSAFNTRGK